MTLMLMLILGLLVLLLRDLELSSPVVTSCAGLQPTSDTEVLSAMAWNSTGRGGLADGRTFAGVLPFASHNMERGCHAGADIKQADHHRGNGSWEW